LRIFDSSDISGLLYPEHACLFVYGFLNSLLQHHTLKSLSFFFPMIQITQLSHPYMTTTKIHTVYYFNFGRNSYVIILHDFSYFVYNTFPPNYATSNFVFHTLLYTVPCSPSPCFPYPL
jgi:hypothetical protein